MEHEHIKIVRTATVALSLDVLLKGQLKFLNEHFNCIAISGEDEHLKKVAQREQIKTIPISFERGIAPFKDMVSLWKLYRVLKKEKPIIVHSMTPKAGLLSMLAAYAAKVPIRIHTFTGLVFPSKKGYLQKLLIWLDRLLCKCATQVYPEGLGVKNDLIKYKITQKPLKIIANGNINGVDTNYFNPSSIHQQEKQNLKKKLGISDSDFVFVFVGRLVGDKGINELVNAFKQLKTKNQKLKTKLILVGPYESELDPLKAETLSEIAQNRHIKTTGFKEDIRSYLAISHGLVFPSYREGFPNVVLQAGAMELPSIVTNINGSNEIIDEGKNGLIIPPKNVVALENAMLKLLNNKNLRADLSKNARPMIVSKYQQQVVWDALHEEYNTLITALR